MPDQIEKQAYWLQKDINKAVYEFDMIEDGDRIAVAVSGGKDSLSLLKLLDYRRKSAQEKYELAVVHVIGDSRGPGCPTHPPLIEWIKESGYQHTISELYVPKGESLPLDCSRCTWNRKKTIFEAAKQMDCNVVALGHHADDFAETTLLNLLFHGKVETMAPVNDYFSSTFRLIRPLCYLEESQIARFAHLNDFPEPPPICPKSSTSRRQMVKEMLAEAQKQHPEARTNLLRAGLRGNFQK
jgi:tRNA 2-thiocytidine biosynthesis protein TtcA